MIGTAILSGLVLMSGSHQPQVKHAAPVKRYRFAEMHMGVPFRISVYARGEQAANKASAAAFRRVAELNAIFSDYDPESEVSRLRAVSPGDSVEVSPELAMLLARSITISRETGGAFDVTVGPLVRQWRRARRRKRLPDSAALRKALDQSGYRHVRLQGRTLTLAAEGMRLDFGAIAKGYACDEALKTLAKHGVTSALIDGGGDIAVSNAPPGQPGWRIQIESEDGDQPAQVLILKNQAVATSGDRYRFVEIDGTRYSHIVDPRTGYGLTSRLTVTVVASTALAADAWASAASVLGARDGLRRIETRCGLQARVRDFSGEQPIVHSSSGFAALLGSAGSE